MQREKFYASVRASFGPLTQPQVSGIESVLDAADKLPDAHVAYLLATAWHETGTKMVAVVENLNYTSAQRIRAVWPSRFPTVASAQPYVKNPIGLANHVYGGRMGNKLVNDGWLYRGRGLVQITGRDNYARASSKLKINLIDNPAKALEPMTSALILVAGCSEGWFTDKKLSDYLPGDYLNARRVVNGTDQAAKIADYARHFEKALTASKYEPVQQKVEPTHWLIALIKKVFK